MKSSLFAIFAFVFILTSCENDSINSDYEELAIQQTQALNLSDEIINQVDLLSSTVINSQSFSNDTVVEYNVNTNNYIIASRDTLLFPKSKRYPKAIVLNFSNGYQISGRVLKGKLIVYLKDTLSQAASNKKIIYNEFYIDNIKFAGNKLISYKGSKSITDPNNLDSTIYLVSSRDSISIGSSKYVFNSYLTRDCIKLGGDTVKYITKGYVAGTDNKSNKFNSGILANNPLIRYSGYPYIVEGIINFTMNSQVATLNYGSGIADNQAILNYQNGETKSITFK